MSHISDILTASYSTSRETFELGRELKSFIGAENNYELIRLACKSWSVITGTAVCIC